MHRAYYLTFTRPCDRACYGILGMTVWTPADSEALEILDRRGCTVGLLALYICYLLSVMAELLSCASLCLRRTRRTPPMDTLIDRHQRAERLIGNESSCSPPHERTAGYALTTLHTSVYLACAAYTILGSHLRFA